MEATTNAFNEFAGEMLGYDPDKAQQLWRIAKQCALLGGVPMGAAVGTMSAGAGTVMVPGIGAVPGWLVGTLAGFFTGTAACTAARWPAAEGFARIKEETDKLLKNSLIR